MLIDLKKTIQQIKTKVTAQKKEYKKITIIARDQDDNLENLLTKIQQTGNIGHTFSIVVDPDNTDYKETFEWDGDGSDMIKDIIVEPVDEI